jgi:hypothetical protein
VTVNSDDVVGFVDTVGDRQRHGSRPAWICETWPAASPARKDGSENDAHHKDHARTEYLVHGWFREIATKY